MIKVQISPDFFIFLKTTALELWHFEFPGFSSACVHTSEILSPVRPSPTSYMDRGQVL